MVFCSFAIRYAIENFLAIAITIALHTLDLYFDWHSKFWNRRTNFFFAVSIIIIFIIIIGWILALILLYIKISKIKKNSFSFTLIKDLKRSKNGILIFYSSFFFVWIFITVLMFVSQQSYEILTVPFWGFIAIVCILIMAIDFKPYSSVLDNFTHVYSQALLVIVLLTGTIISAKGAFKSPFKQ